MCWTGAAARVAGALLDLWHCDAAGVYDNDGYRLRGHQFSDAEGRFVFETIVPWQVSWSHAPLSRQAAGAGAAAFSPRSSIFRARPGETRVTASSIPRCCWISRWGTAPNLARYDFVLDLG